MLLIDEDQKGFKKEEKKIRGVRREREKEEQKQVKKGQFIPEILSPKGAL
jgi:hypothetical protein